VNVFHAKIHAGGEQAMATLKQWRPLLKLRCSTIRITDIVKVLLRADDLTVFPVADPVATIVSAGHPGLVDTVAGRVVKRDGVLANVDLAALRTRLLESRSRIGAAADVPLEGTGRPQPAAQ
jgi:hypothetical protein